MISRKANARSSCHRLRVTAGWPSDVHTILWALQRHRTATLLAPYDYRKSVRSFLGQDDNLKPCVVLTIIVRCPYGDHTMSLRCVYGLQAYDFFQICHCAELNKIVEATMPVNPYDDRKVSLRRRYGNGDLDIVRASYTRNKANVTEALAPFICKWGLFRNWFWRFKVPRNFGNLKYPTRVHSWVRTDGVDLLLDLLSLRPRR